jgi:APA family basic amino acid/polyamine antiporter
MLGGGEMLFSMSLRGDVPRFFSRTNRFNAPYAAQLGSLAMSSVLLAFNASKETTQLFAFITVLASDAVLYLYAAAAIAAALKDRKPLTLLAAAVGLAFVLFAFYGSGLESFLLSLGLMVLGSGSM